MSDRQPARDLSSLLPVIARDATRALKQFGYRVSSTYVEEAVNRLANATEQPKGGPEMMIVGWLEEAGLRREEGQDEQK